MDKKLEELLKRINLEESSLAYFNNATIEKVVVEKSTNNWRFFIKNDNILPYEVYKSLEEKLKDSIHDNTKLEIITNTTDYSLVNEYFKEMIDKISINSTRYNVFKDRTLEVDNVSVTLNVYNKIEELNIENIEDKLIKKLKQVGFNNIDFKINFTKKEDNELLNEIEKEKEVQDNIN